MLKRCFGAVLGLVPAIREFIAMYQLITAVHKARGVSPEMRELLRLAHEQDQREAMRAQVRIRAELGIGPIGFAGS